MTSRPECSLVQERLPALQENDLTPGEMVLVRAHLKGCRPCEQAWLELHRMVRDLTAIGPTPGEFAAARAALKEALRRERKPRTATALAAAALLLVVGMAFSAVEVSPPSLKELRLASRAITAGLRMPRIAWSRLPPTWADDLAGERK